MKQKPGLLIFDLDGTLVDTAPDIAYSIDEMLSKVGLPTAGIDKVRRWIGDGVPMLVKRALTGDMWPESEPEGFSEAMLLFGELYQANFCKHSRLFTGVLAGLQTLKDEGYHTCCITNKSSRFALPLLAQLDISRYLDFIGCGDQFEKHKPDPYPLLKAAERFGISPERCLMVGDSENDVVAARAAGCGIFCVSYGYRICEEVEELKADRVIQTLLELPTLLHSLPKYR